ncbi:helix-turn-helix domain-containing protein [Pectobacterium carotovorum]|uniref:helix-turn-helix domain-containing protein n=1 Tax=Pectobacterium carotovorum TaxID=554 RepID=UPI00057CB4E2|nr:helix-turn-helix transcriptional regulator [Pectobacterium carotovorum]KHT35061.1 XRE family transcriptional regulator [Pectobacterium carotovorum subsp. carotovorum]
MSTSKEEFLFLIGGRLREERETIGKSQSAIAEELGTTTRTWGKYERGETAPDGATLAFLSENYGMDTLYILTGKRTPDLGDISNDELELVKIYRAAPLAIKAAALAALTAGSSATAGSINVTGSGQRVAGRDYHEGKK